MRRTIRNIQIEPAQWEPSPNVRGLPLHALAPTLELGDHIAIRIELFCEGNQSIVIVQKLDTYRKALQLPRIPFPAPPRQ